MSCEVQAKHLIGQICTTQIVVSDIKVQEAIVSIYLISKIRKRINEQLKNNIKPHYLC